MIDFICMYHLLGRAPVLFACKKDSSLCLCINFHGLDKIMKKDHYPLPHISNLLDSPCKARIFSKIDLCHAYHLVCIHEGDEWKTTFYIWYGSFEWHIMPFGLMNVPTGFQHFMNDIFGDLLNVCILVYLDDIIYSNSEEEHKWHIHEILCSNSITSMPMPTSASSMLKWLSIKAIFFLQVGSPWPPTRSKSFRIGLNPTRLKTYSPSWVSPISISVLFHNTLTSPFHLPALPTKESHGISLTNATLLSTCWRRPSSLH